MNAQLEELIAKISSGCLAEDEVARIAAEAAQAYADPAAFLAANPDVNYDDEFPIPLGEWVVVGSLPDTVLFQADSYEELFQRITESFGPQVQFVLKAKQLPRPSRSRPSTASRCSSRRCRRKPAAMCWWTSASRWTTSCKRCWCTPATCRG